MEGILKNSDTLLRPDIGLVLPAVAAYYQNWLLIALSAAVQPFKWQSGCGCFAKLCGRRTFSIRAAAVLAVGAPLLYYSIGLPVTDFKMVVAATFGSLLLSRESHDTIFLKTVYMVSAFYLPVCTAFPLIAVVTAFYAYITGWTIRGSDHVDVLAANSVWLVTRDGRLAKRVNNYGEFHLEYRVGKEIVIVGDGRLVGEKGDELKNDLKKSDFMNTDGNQETLECLIAAGKAISKGDSVSFSK